MQLAESYARRKRFEARVLVAELARALSETNEKKTSPGQFLAAMGTQIRGK